VMMKKRMTKTIAKGNDAVTEEATENSHPPFS